ncbi:hypothetical protein TSTA_054390 [Talaromyces stipitatus ATCC 10500]|uniref:Inositol polyphosphate-related phosphatase domain-containing protein n=1 Tax=Talaromyces stipitatus (strain ATCC 10500 / CBS 375.48 / QM 6759 / NRRL 1006) TaxID=441959 RepID=B8MR33_TALSN|nr:uncharacterized protein TSTA_054390 [Talaromyces stipitatus ATCC 10500]EED12928.1 hypothetical protein TSTA_054390 [Talaromyces stipitatus ATCC 10500]
MTNPSAHEECLSAYILTFNCARNPIHQDYFAAHLFDVLPQQQYNSAPPEFLVLSLQEVAPIYSAFLGGSFLIPYLSAFQKAVDIATRNRWPCSTAEDDRVRYVNVVTHHCGLTALLVFVRSDIVDKVVWTDTAEVGVGLLEMGNKGAVGARLGYVTSKSSGRSETMELTFVAAHIAPMEDAYERRNQDWRSIVERLVFTRSAGDGDRGDNGYDEDTHLLQQDTKTEESGMFSPRSHFFFAGDLNYRTSDVPPIPGDHTRYPQPHATPNDAIHHTKLLKNDQLTRELLAKRTLHGLSEAPITFPPTYKYSEEAQKAALSGEQSQESSNGWKWANKRWPSDVQVQGYNALPLFPTSDHRAVALAVTIPLQPITPPASSQLSGVDDVRLHPPFPIDPTWRTRRENARIKEVVVGGLAYLALTWEGNGILLASVAGMFGGWIVLRSLLLGEVSGGLEI